MPKNANQGTRVICVDHYRVVSSIQEIKFKRLVPYQLEIAPVVYLAPFVVGGGATWSLSARTVSPTSRLPATPSG
jgi:hypothetical protein